MPRGSCACPKSRAQSRAGRERRRAALQSSQTAPSRVPTQHVHPRPPARQDRLRHPWARGPSQSRRSRARSAAQSGRPSAAASWRRCAPTRRGKAA
eukprot:5837648-Prymnesium_polylepis.3